MKPGLRTQLPGYVLLGHYRRLAPRLGCHQHCQKAEEVRRGVSAWTGAPAPSEGGGGEERCEPGVMSEWFSWGVDKRGESLSGCIFCLPCRFFLTSLQLFFQLIGMKQTNSKKDWFLSEEEFKLWTRLYRLKDSDGIKEVTLPRVRFLSLQNEKDRPVSWTVFRCSL